MLNLNPFTAQQTLHINPTKEERKPTNAPFLTIFCCILFLWIWIIFKVISDERELGLFLASAAESELQLHPRWSWEFPLGTVLSGLIAFIYIYILSQYGGRYVVYIGMFFLWCLIFLVPIGLIATGVIQRPFSYGWTHHYVWLTLQIIVLILIIAYVFTTMCSVYNTDKDAIFEIIRNACRVLRCCPSIAIFSFAMSIIIILVLIFTIYLSILIFFDQSPEQLLMTVRSNRSTFNFELYSHSYCASTVIYFLMNFTQMVISGYVMDWFWSKDPNVNSLKMRRSLGRTLNFHMGSVAFFSILPLPQMWSLFQVCRCRDSDKDIVKRYNIFTRFFSQIHLFMNIMNFGLIQTSIYGYESRTAILAAHDLVAQNNHQFYLAVCGISDMVIFFGVILLAIPHTLENMFFCIYAVAIPFYMALATAIRTLLVNKMIINYTSEALKEEDNSANPSVHPITVL